MKRTWQNGFSIVEVLIAVSILSLVLSGLYNVFYSQYRSFEAQRDVLVTQRDIRASLSLLERDIRMSGFGVPRGSNPVAALQDGTVDDATDPDTISINFSPGPFTYLTSSTVTSPGVDNIIQVDSVAAFQVLDTINIINNSDNNLIGTPYVIKGIDTGNVTLSLVTDPSGAGIDVGDFVVRDFKTITYSTAIAGTGRRELRRGDGVVQSTIIDGVVDFQLSYILDDGTEVTSPGDLSDISLIRIDLIAETTKETAQLGAQQIPRELTTIIPIKNSRL
jgi:prepilin-type N-terminal cleavage/methylation domain-containing protein